MASPLAIVTGSGGLVGSEAARRLVAGGFDVVGVENDMRARFFGPEASTAPVTAALEAELDAFRTLEIDVRDAGAIDRLVARHARVLALVVHAAAQPSHDWAASDPQTDFAVNANGTLHLLQAVRDHAPDATFVFLSTNKVYGDRPNALPLVRVGRRLDLPVEHPQHAGIDATMPVDRTTHSLFGVSKLAADLLVQEYGRCFEMPTVCLRGGCLTGPRHAGTELHGFLSYLMRCTMAGRPYTVFGHGGLQVRDNIHAADVVRAITAFHAAPRPAAVYNLGGGRERSVSVLEAIAMCERIAGRELQVNVSPRARTGDHRWWISDLRPFMADHPGWRPEVGLEQTLHEIHDANTERWRPAGAR